MAVINQQQHPRWYQDKERVYTGLARSSWVTAATDWFMSFAGKAVELVLYATVLYSCAQLYPGVALPARLSLAVFLVQMGALDIGGLAMGKLARQANEEGNTAGARHARHLSYGLIAIMLVSVATVGIERVVPVSSQVRIAVELVLVIARSVGSVLYGRVVHDLKPIDAPAIPLMAAPDVLTLVEQQLSEQAQAFGRHLDMLAQRMEENEQNTAFHFQQFQMETRQHGEAVSQQFSYETSVISEQLSSLISSINLRQISQETEKESEIISQETDTESDEEVREEAEEDEEPEAANDADGAKAPGRKYYVTFEAASELTGLSILQLKRRVNAGEIEVNTHGKVRVKSLQNLSQKPRTTAKEIPAGKPALSLVRSPAS